MNPEKPNREVEQTLPENTSIVRGETGPKADGNGLGGNRNGGNGSGLKKPAIPPQEPKYKNFRDWQEKNNIPTTLEQREAAELARRQVKDTDAMNSAYEKWAKDSAKENEDAIHEPAFRYIQGFTRKLLNRADELNTRTHVAGDIFWKGNELEDDIVNRAWIEFKNRFATDYDPFKSKLSTWLTRLIIDAQHDAFVHWGLRPKADGTWETFRPETHRQFAGGVRPIGEKEPAPSNTPDDMESMSLPNRVSTDGQPKYVRTSGILDLRLNDSWVVKEPGENSGGPSSGLDIGEIHRNIHEQVRHLTDANEIDGKEALAFLKYHGIWNFEKTPVEEIAASMRQHPATVYRWTRRVAGKLNHPTR